MEVFIFLGILVVLLLIVNWIVHISMVRDSALDYGYAGFKKFIKHFNNTEWEHDDGFKFSLFGKQTRFTFEDDYYHANIIRFKGKGMIVNNPISYIMVQIYVQLYIRKHFREEKLKYKRNNVKW